MYTTGVRVPGTTLEEKESHILTNLNLLCLIDYTLTEYDNCVEDFIHNFLVVYNRKYKTGVVNKNIEVLEKPVATNALKHRSLIDIFLISKYYFPECTLKQCIKGLYSLNDSLCTQICSTIHRRVYEIRITQSDLWKRHLADHDELGYNTNYYLTILNS